MPGPLSSAASTFRRCASLIQLHPSDVPDSVRKSWNLGFTAFGGPPVHFQILHKKFVEQNQWIDEQLFQEIFALSQALPGPASTKMLFCINYIHGGLLAGVTAFLFWSLPGAIGMFGLSLGISKVGDTLPLPVYALLSGLNSATVGIIALAAVQLSDKAITDKLTRALVFLGGVAGILYTALWYFPVLMLISGIITIIWDFRFVPRSIGFLRRKIWPSSVQREDTTSSFQREEIDSNSLAVTSNDRDSVVNLRRLRTTEEQNIGISTIPTVEESDTLRTSQPIIPLNLVTWKTGISILGCFIVSFLMIMLLRSLLPSLPRPFALFSNLYLAGTIIFGGGPVVIPLLREYIVAEGWVSSRDFLLGLALIQSFPGPNFNFAVYLGALSVRGTSFPSVLGALIGFLAIFTPGLVILVGVMGVWKQLRTKRWLLSLLRGVNAGAVGLVFTAVYKLWQIGFVDAEHQSGSPLGRDPWWVAITATSFVGGAWFGLSAPLAILLGGVMGMIWFAVTKA